METSNIISVLKTVDTEVNIGIRMGNWCVIRSCNVMGLYIF
jgi:hypothetical protein